MIWIRWILLLSFSYGIAQNTEQSYDLVYPHRQGESLYLSSRPFSSPNNKIKVDGFDFDNSTREYYVVEKNMRYGVFDIYGVQVKPFAYDSIRNCGSDLLMWKNGQFDLLIEGGSKFTKIQADSTVFHDDILYYYHNGLCGLINYNLQIKPSYKAIRPWQLFVKSYEIAEFKDYYLAVKPNGDYQLLDKNGRELLPTGVTQINEVSYGIVRFYDGVWKYYLSLRDEIISSDGNDIIFYSQQIYKKYNADRSRGTLRFLDQKRKTSGRYDDYFLLADTQYLAVRKDNLIGLVNRQTEQEIIPPKYQQINSMKFMRDEFRCYQNDLCGVVNRSGEEVIPLIYHNVQQTPNEQFYASYFNNKMGIVEKGGKMILPHDFTYIHFVDDENIILHQNGMHGLSNYRGELLCPIENINYKVQILNSKRFFEFYNGKDYLLCDAKGIYFKQRYERAIFANDCIKLYTHDKKIIVFYLDEKGELVETFEYRNLTSITLDDHYGHLVHMRNSITLDELEENQLTGKFGKRFYNKPGMSVQPIYTVLIRNHGSDFIFGEMNHKPYTNTFAPKLTLEANTSWNYVLHNNQYTFSMNELLNANSWATDSYYGFKQSNHGIDVYSNSSQNRKIEAMKSPILYAENIGFGTIRKLTFGDKVSIVDIEESDLSLYAYYRWINNMGVFTVNPNDMVLIMNPKLGVKFENPRYLVCEPSDSWKLESRDYFDKCVEFSSFEFNPDLRLKASTSKNQDKTVWQHITYTDKDKREKVEFTERYFQVPESDYLAKEKSGNHVAVTHPKFPDFVFAANSFNIEYKHGVLVQRLVDSTFRLVYPDNRLILNNLDTAKHIANGLFLIREKNQNLYAIYSLAKNAVIQTNILNLVECNEKYVSLRLANGFYWPGDTQNNLIFISSLGEISVEKPESASLYDTATLTKKSLSHWEFYNGRTLKKTTFSTPWKLKSMLDGFMMYHGNYFYLLDADLNLVEE